MHHYCWALSDIKRKLYIQAVGNLDYVLTNSKKTFKLRPLVLKKKAEVLMFLNKYPDLVLTLNELIVVRPRSEWGYIMLATTYKMLGQNDAAQKIVQIGLKKIPNSKSLKKLKNNLK